MGFTEILTAQLVDPFRIGLLFFLIMTTRRTAAQTGNILPVVFGALFIAVLIPNSLGAAATDNKLLAVAVGLASNAVILAVLYGALRLFDRLRQG